MQDKITVKELYEDWAIDNPHYEFWYKNSKVISLQKFPDGPKPYDLFCDSNDGFINYWLQPYMLIEVRPKTAHPTELQDPSDLDATLPIIPAETAQRDHDEIQRLRAENAKMRRLLEGLAKFKDSQNGNLRHFATRAWNLLNRS